MPQFTSDHIFILPHAQEYALLYDVSIEDVLLTLNDPDTNEGLATGHYTVEKQIGTRRLYVYYYRTLPLQGKTQEYFAIVDFIGYTGVEDRPQKSQGRRERHIQTAA
jgi:hypothetical protein